MCMCEGAVVVVSKLFICRGCYGSSDSSSERIPDLIGL